MKQIRVILGVVLALVLLGGSTAVCAAVIFDLGDQWQWLHPQGGAAADPELTDPDFNDPTNGWMANVANFAANYAGPAFNPPAPGILGYGNIDLAPGVQTNIVDPGSGNRYTAYFRKEFSLPAGHYNLNANALIDDGAIIYIDGIEVGRHQMNGQVESYLSPTTSGALGNEVALTNLALNGGNVISLTGNDHVIAVSVHNASPTSSDLGFDLRLNAPSCVPDFGGVLPQSQNFSAVPLNFTDHAGTPNTSDLGFTGGGFASPTFGVKDPASKIPDLTLPHQGHVFASAGQNHTFRTAPIDARLYSNLFVFFDFRTGDLSDGFEANDVVRFFVEGSGDGGCSPYSRIAGVPDIVLTGANLNALDSGPIERFATFSFALPAFQGAVRLGMERTGTVSRDEFLFLDNINVFPESAGQTIFITTPSPPGPLGHGQTVLIQNFGDAGGSLANLTVATSNGTFRQVGLTNGVIPGGASRAGTIVFDSPGLLNGLQATGTLSFDLTGPPGSVGAGFKAYDLRATVSGNQGTQGAAITAGGSFAGLSGNSDKSLDSTATLLAGTNGGGATTLAMSWQERDAVQFGGGPDPPAFDFSDRLVSDVLEMTGADGDTFVLQMNYDPAQLESSPAIAAARGLLYLAAYDVQASLQASLWVNAIDLNHGANVGQTNILGGWSGQTQLGAWGVDITNNVVWAVLDHNSFFAVVPEPASVCLSALGLLAVALFAAYRRRG